MERIERRAHAMTVGSPSVSGHDHPRRNVAIAALAIAFACAPVRAEENPPTTRPDALPLATPVDLRVDRAPIAAVLGQLAAAAGLERAETDGSAEVRVTGPLAGSLRAVLAGLVADHDLVLDVADGTLDVRSGGERRTLVLDTTRSNQTATDGGDTTSAMDLPGNVVTSSGSTLVISGHPTFVARVERRIVQGEATDPASTEEAVTSSGKSAPATGRDADSVPLAAARSRPDADGSAASPPKAAAPPANAIRSVDDVPGFY